MASDEDEPSDAFNDREDVKIYYKCCAKKLCKSVICVNCNACYHTSCAKNSTNIKNIGGNRVVCCDKKLNDSHQKIIELEENAKYLKEILLEVRGRNSALELANKLLLEKIKYLEDKSVATNAEQCEVKIKQSYSTVADQRAKTKTFNGKRNPELTTPSTSSCSVIDHTGNKVAKSIKTRSQSTNSISNSTVENGNNKQQISSPTVKSAILEAQTAVKLREIQQLANQNDDWKIQKRRQSRRFVVGGNNDEAIEIKAIPKYVSLHVTRLRPNTKPEELKKMLLNEFPEVQCESHLSKYPELYSSMKVTIKQEHFKKAWRKSVWPEGALVSKFFAPKRIPSANRVDPQSK